MKTKNALGGLLGLLGSFSALPFLTESLHHNQPTSKRNPVRMPQAKTNRNRHQKHHENGGRSEKAGSIRTWSRRRWTSPSTSSWNLQHQIKSNKTKNNQQQPTRNSPKFATIRSRFRTRRTFGSDRRRGCGCCVLVRRVTGWWWPVGVA
jgi:hypothetical protein